VISLSHVPEGNFDVLNVKQDMTRTNHPGNIYRHTSISVVLKSQFSPYSSFLAFYVTGLGKYLVAT